MALYTPMLPPPPPLRLAVRASLAPSSTIRELLAVTELPGMRSLAGGLPDPATFPVDALRDAAQRVLVAGSDRAYRALQYGPTDGLADFRAAIARSTVLHGLHAMNPDELVVTTGSQQALDLLTRTLIDPGDDVAVEDPCYLGARQTFLAGGAVLRGIPVDAQGMQTDVLAELLAAGYRPRFVYTVANFQNPTGATLNADRRRALVALAEQYGFVIVEDDPYRSLSFTGQPFQSLGALNSDVVVSLGSLSKVLSPGMRLGWLRAPTWIREAIVRAKQACDLHTSTLTQLIALQILEMPGFIDGHIAANRIRYANRADALCSALAARGFEAAMPSGGMFTWVHMPGIDTEALLAQVIAEGVAFVPGAAFAVDQQWQHYARLSFATLGEPDLVIAANILADVANSFN